MGRTSITEAEILGALHDAMTPAIGVRPPNTYTRQELQDLSGHCKDKVLTALRRLLTTGAVTRLEIQVLDTTGRVQRVPAYQFKNGRPE
jgi:hypothetical protein